VAAVGGAFIFPTWSFLDHVGAIIVSIFILHAATKIIWPAARELVDTGAPTELQNKIAKISCSHRGVLEIHKIRTRYISSSLQVDMHIVVDGSITVREGHAIADAVESQIMSEIPEVLDVVIHVDPPDAARPDDEVAPDESGATCP